MKFNIEIAKVLDKHLPANGQGTEREKLRTDLMIDLLMVVNKLPIHSVSRQSDLLLQCYKEGFQAAVDSLVGANEAVKNKTLQYPQPDLKTNYYD